MFSVNLDKHTCEPTTLIPMLEILEGVDEEPIVKSACDLVVFPHVHMRPNASTMRIKMIGKKNN